MKNFYNLWALLVFITIMLLIIPIIFLGSLFGTKGINFNYKVVNLWAKTWFLCIGIKYKLTYETPHDKNKQYIFIANHQSYLDAATIALSITQPFRVLGQYETSTVPFLGYIWKTCVITVKRGEISSRIESVRRLKSEIIKGVSIFLFPEGKFNDSDDVLCKFYDGAFRIAIETQTPIKPMLLLDTGKRLHYSEILGLNPGYNRVIYLDEVDVTGLTLNDVTLLKEKVFSLMESSLINYKLGYL